MAVPSSISSATMKAVVLPLILVVLAVAASTVDATAVDTAAGRFTETPMGRKLLNINFCGSGTPPDYNCRVLLPFANKPMCCPDILGNRFCWDVNSIIWDKCGSCTSKCLLPSFCCKGVCANLLTDKNNCGKCGRKCPGNEACTFGFCRY